MFQNSYAMKALFIFVISGLGISAVFAQDTPKQHYRANSLGLELGGSGILYSVNYERTLLHLEQLDMLCNTGAELFFNRTTEFYLHFEPDILAFPWPRHALEMGFSLMCGGDTHNYKNMLRVTALSFRLGYRYYFPGERFFLRFGITPFWQYNDENNNPDDYVDNYLQMWGGFGFGWKF